MTTNDDKAPRQDVYSRITNQIIEALEQGVKPWTQPWNAAHAAGHVSRPLRHNGQPYAGINVLTLWASAMTRHYAAPIWMTFKQALELGGCVRKGEKGSPVVYANTITRTETDDATGDDVDRSIPFLKAYTVFNIEQIDGLPAHYYARAESSENPDQRIAQRRSVLRRHPRRHPAWRRQRVLQPRARLHPDAAVRRRSATRRATTRRSAHEMHALDSRTSHGLTAISGASASAMKATPAKNSSPSWARRSCAPIWACGSKTVPIMPPISARWLQVLKDDKRAIFSAAAHAQRAADYLHGLQKPAAIPAEAA